MVLPCSLSAVVHGWIREEWSERATMADNLPNPSAQRDGKETGRYADDARSSLAVDTLNLRRCDHGTAGQPSHCP